jgi:hypothetical protein
LVQTIAGIDLPLALVEMDLNPVVVVFDLVKPLLSPIGALDFNVASCGLINLECASARTQLTKKPPQTGAAGILLSSQKSRTIRGMLSFLLPPML